MMQMQVESATSAKAIDRSLVQHGSQLVFLTADGIDSVHRPQYQVLPVQFEAPSCILVEHSVQVETWI